MEGDFLMKRIWTGCMLALLIPYIVTLAFGGTIKGEMKQAEFISGKKVMLSSGREVDAEEYLVGVVGKQMPADYGAEALKAQAVVARTYLYKQMGEADEIQEAELKLEYLEEKQLEELWGSDRFVTYYKNIQEAVEGTGGTVMACEGELIDPLFHRASAGKTRTGDQYHPYLEGVESLQDVEAEGYLSMVSWEIGAFVSAVNGNSEYADLTAGQLPESIQLIERDESGYVEKIQIGSHTFTGEEVQAALGLPSSCFTLEGYEGQIRAVCKGIGHGYGMSQYGASVLAGRGQGFEEILTYYFKNIDLISG